VTDPARDAEIRRSLIRGVTDPPPERVIAALSQQASFSVGCYCEDEARCHRSLLRELFEERGARLA
jgi:uncharacterized protein YeaO (DUF488 family)